MKKDKLYLVVLFALIGCGQSKRPTTLISSLNKKIESNSQQNRFMASNLPSGCHKDDFTVENLKREIDKLELNYTSGTPIKGSWKHLRLDQLPIPQANFLRKYGNQLGDLNNPDAIDYSGCSDVPCIFNQIYGKQDYIAGYVHYLWFLKYAYLLAADNQVFRLKESKPGNYNEKEFPLESYLWKESELYGFWRLSHMLKNKYLILPQMQEIQRIPHGEKIEEVEEEYKLALENWEKEKASGTESQQPVKGAACGYSWNNGYINLQDACLKFESNLDESFFYLAATHEIAHQIDYSLDNISLKQHYLDLSRFEIVEYLDKDNQLKKVWKLTTGGKAVTIYAAISPIENFAETLAVFRIIGDGAKLNTRDDHYSYVSENYYGNSNFETESLIKNWIDSRKNLMTQLSFKAVSDCMTSSKPFSSSYFSSQDFATPLPPNLLNCISSKANDIDFEIKKRSMREEPQACQFLENEKSKSMWKQEMHAPLKQFFERYLLEYEKDKGYFDKIKSFTDDLGDKSLAIEAFMNCYDNDESRNCFENSLNQLVSGKISSLNLPDHHQSDLLEMYKNYHAFTSTKDHVLLLYNSYLESQSELIASAATELFEACEGLAPSDVEPPTGKHFSVGNGYMVSSHYNCINMQFPDVVKGIVRDLEFDGRGIQDGNEELIITEQLRSKLKSELGSIYSEKSGRELLQINLRTINSVAKVRAEVLSDFSWAKDQNGHDSIQAVCIERAYELVPIEPLYNYKKDLYQKFVEDVCKDIKSSQEYKTWMESKSEEFRGQASSIVENKVLSLASTQAKKCLQTYPVDSNLNRSRYKKPREACLLEQWGQLESKALDDFMKDPMVIKFKIDRIPLQSNLELNRRKLQIKVMKENGF